MESTSSSAPAPAATASPAAAAAAAAAPREEENLASPASRQEELPPLPSSSLQRRVSAPVVLTSSMSSHHSQASIQPTGLADQEWRGSATGSTTIAPITDISSFQASWANNLGANMFGSTNELSSSFLFSAADLLDGSSSHLSSSIMADRMGSKTASAATLPLLSSSTSGAPLLLQRHASVGSRISSHDPTSLLHDAARITDWDKVLELCTSHPEYAKYTNTDGWTALHHACNRRCPRPEVVDALIQAHPQALVMAEDSKEWLPLHYACRFKAPKDVVRLLLHSDAAVGRRTVSQKDRQGRTPLYYAVRYDAPPGVVGLLLEVNPAAVLEEDDNDESPLGLVWNSWADKLEGKRVIRSFLPGGYPEPEGITDEMERARLLQQRLRSQHKLLQRWNKVNMLLKAAFGFPVEEPHADEIHSNNPPTSQSAPARTWRILHAVSAVKCHLSLFLLACALHPEQARELDESDLRRPSDPMLTGVSTHQTALHLAASSNAGGEAGKTVIQDLLDLFRNAAHVQDAIDGSLPLHRLVENPNKQDWSNFGSLLYHVYPRALHIPDHQGRLVLHRAAAAAALKRAFLLTTSSPEMPRRRSSSITAAGGDDSVRMSVMMNLVRLAPQAASHADQSGCVPLHMLALHAHVWDDDVAAVHNAHGAAVQLRTGPAYHNRLPLHLACTNPRGHHSLITKLVQLHPRGVSVPDKLGKWPFHLACEHGREWSEGLQEVYEAYPAALTQREENKRGWYPLHMAAHCPTASRDLLEHLVRLAPHIAEMPDSQGEMPLHLACQAGKKWQEGLEILFTTCPEAVATADARGYLPLHVAALHYCKDGKKTALNNLPPPEEETEANSTTSANDSSFVAEGPTTTTDAETAEPVEGEQEEEQEPPPAPTAPEDSVETLAELELIYQLLRSYPSVL